MMFNERISFGGRPISGLGECPIIRPEGIYYGGRRVIRLDPALGVGATPTVTWVDWYNSQSLDNQNSFDEDAAALDEALTTPTQKQNYIDTFGGSADEKAALQNYLATGGRAALFARPEKNYGPTPVATIKPAGPIEQAPSGVTLHPGTYSYSKVTSTGVGFDRWLQDNTKTVKNTVVQASAGVLPGSGSYYTDNLLNVYQDTLWPSTLIGLPTWLPPGTNMVKYWGEVTPPARPDWDAIIPDKSTVRWVGVAVAAVVVVVVGGAIIYYAPRRAPAPAPVPA